MRLFTALSLPEDIRKALSFMQGGVPGAHWTKFENYHITLTFIGEVPESAVEDITEALENVRVKPFPASLQGTGSFSTGKAEQYLWFGVRADEALYRLKEKIDRALETCGVPFESRKYTPHVTQARLRQADEAAVARFMQEYNLFAAGPFEVKEFFLFESSRTAEGLVYEPLRLFKLA